MNTILKSKSSLRAAILAGSIATLFLPAKGLATNATWIGADGVNSFNNDTNNPANWMGGVVYPKDFGIVTFDNNTANGNMTINEFPFFTGGLTLAPNLTQDITITGLTLFTGDADIDMSAAGANLTVNSSLAMYGAAHPSVWIVGTGRTLTFTGSVTDSNSAGLTKNGAGTVVLTSAVTTASTTTINGGTFQIAVAGTINAGTYSGNISIATGANLQYSSSADQTFSSIISGAGSLTKDTSGSTLYLSGANTNTGTATVSAGILKYANVAAVGSTSGITVNGTGSVWFDPGTAGGTISTPISLSGDGGGNCALNTYTPGGQVTFSGPITMTGSSLIRAIGDNSTMNFTNAIHGTGDLSFAGFGGGAGTKDYIVLSGASDFSGGFALVNWYGAVQATLSGGDNRLPTTALVTVHGSAGGYAGALDLNGNNQTIAGLTDTLGFGGLDAGSRSVVNTSGTAVTLTLNTTANQSSGVSIGGTDINGTTGNNLSLVKSGSATQTLSGANTYTGNTTISAGTLEIGGAGSLGAGSYAGDISIAGALLYNSSANQILSGIITGSGSITKNGSGTLTLTQALNAYPVHLFDGAITINSGTLIAPNEYFNLNTASSITVNGGMLNMQTRPSELGNLILNGGTVTSTGVENTSFGNIILYTDTTVHAGGAAVSTISVNQVKLRGTNGFDVSAGSTLNLTSEVGEYGGVGSLTKTGAGKLALSGTNTYTGVTTLAGGTLNVASLSDYGVAGSLGNRAAVDDAPGIVGILFQGGTLQYTGSTAQSTNRGIRISTVGGGATIDASGSNPAATLSFTAASSPDFFENGGNRTLTLTGSNTGANTFAMGIGDAIGATSVVKNGAGTWVITGANSYTGGTMVSDGTLKVASATALGGNSGAVSVTSGAVLDLNGTTMTNTNALTLNGTGISSGGALINSSGTAGTYAGAVTLQTSSSMGGTGDITLSNTVTGGAGVTLTKVGGDTLNINGAVSDGTTLAANEGTTNVNAAIGTGTSNVSVIGAGTTLKFGSVSQTLSSLTIGAGSTVTFTSGLASFSGGGKAPSLGGSATVPEPGTLGLLLVGALGMLNRRRRQA